MKAPNLNHLFMQAPVAICIVSGPQFNVELVNERMLQFLGRTQSIVGLPLQQTLTEAREQGLLSILQKVRTNKEAYTIANFPSVIRIDGVRQARYFDLTFKPYFITPEEKEPDGVFCVAHNVTDAVQVRQNLEEEKQRTALALETGELGIMSTDWASNTVTVNKRTAEIFGLESHQPLESYIARIHPQDRDKRTSALASANLTGQFDFEVRLLFPNGAIRWVRSRGLILKNSEGQITGSFGVVQDITAQKQFALALSTEVEQQTDQLEAANKALQQKNEDLKRSNTNLEEFARAASHDLKEPTRKMQVFASRLREMLDDRLSTSEKEVFSRMENAAERMGLLVDDLLEYTQLDYTPPLTESINLEEKIARILIDLELLIAEKKASIQVGPLPTVKGHRRQLQQLFQNLLINALKYSRAGVSPQITITSKKVKGIDLPEKLPQSASELSFYSLEVSDNGIGFHPEEGEKIFQIFTRLHTKEAYSGTGVGLSIAKKVVENHGGYIYATGQQGKGATFTVLLPAASE